MNAIEALKVMKTGCEVEQLFRDPLAVREKLRYFHSDNTICLFLVDFGKGATDIMSPDLFLKSFKDAEFVLFESK